MLGSLSGDHTSVYRTIHYTEQYIVRHAPIALMGTADVGFRHISVPEVFAPRIRAISKSLALHAAHAQVAGRPFHHGKCASLAARPSIGEAAYVEAIKVHKARDRATHRWADVSEDGLPEDVPEVTSASSSFPQTSCCDVVTDVLAVGSSALPPLVAGACFEGILDLIAKQSVILDGLTSRLLEVESIALKGGSPVDVSVIPPLLVVSDAKTMTKKEQKRQNKREKEIRENREFDSLIFEHSCWYDEVDANPGELEMPLASPSADVSIELDGACDDDFEGFCDIFGGLEVVADAGKVVRFSSEIEVREFVPPTSRCFWRREACIMLEEFAEDCRRRAARHKEEITRTDMLLAAVT
jgi:hypothetical protein